MDASGPDDGIHTVGQLRQDVVALRGGKGRHDVCACGIWSCRSDVVINGLLEQPIVLEHERDALHELTDIDLTDVYVAYADGTRGNVPKARDKARCGGLAATRGSYQRDGGTLIHREARIRERITFRALVAEADMVKCDAVSIRRLRIVGLGKDGRAQDAVGPLRRICGDLDLFHHEHEARDGPLQ